jgi:peptidoglycan/LPS O-acetylase OafA/YrhL
MQAKKDYYSSNPRKQGVIMEQVNVKKRLNYFDWIRGLMILWMLIYHISLNYGKITFGEPEEGASVFTFMSFFMATFYVGSGYFFSDKKDFRNFLLDKLKKIGIPYVTFSIWGVVIFEVYCLLTSGQLGDLDLFASIRTGCVRQNGPLWFLFSLFFCNIIYYALSKTGGKIKNVIILVCILAAYITHNKVQILSYGNILLGLTFFHFGYLLRHYGERLNNWIFGVIALVTCLTIGLFSPQRLEFVRNFLVQGDWIVNFIYTACACFFLWYISQLWEHDNSTEKGLLFLGRESIVVYAFHRPVLNWVIEPIIRYIYPSVNYFEFLTISLVSILILYAILNHLLNKYCPQLIGKRRQLTDI